MIISEDDLDTPQPTGVYRCCEVCKNVPCKPTFKINCTNKSDKCPHWVSSANIKSDFRDQDIGQFYCNKSMYEHDTAIHNSTLDEIEIQIMKKEEWTRLELLAIIGYNRSPETSSGVNHE